MTPMDSDITSHKQYSNVSSFVIHVVNIIVFLCLASIFLGYAFSSSSGTSLGNKLLYTFAGVGILIIYILVTVLYKPKKTEGALAPVYASLPVLAMSVSFWFLLVTKYKTPTDTNTSGTEFVNYEMVSTAFIMFQLILISVSLVGNIIIMNEYDIGTMMYSNAYMKYAITSGALWILTTISIIFMLWMYVIVTRFLTDG
jgi:hypothetical protein|tara:strand:+ start:5685 stop:6281 length:597 start_codon:yes stop_codon:yes gene_type:complete